MSKFKPTRSESHAVKAMAFRCIQALIRLQFKEEAFYRAEAIGASAHAFALSKRIQERAK